MTRRAPARDRPPAGDRRGSPRRHGRVAVSERRLAIAAGVLYAAVSLPRLTAAMTSMILTLQPVASVALGAVLLGQEPSALQLCGVALILAGLSVAVRPRRAARA
jgi:drug/metabolite transporter (DMT)-like permease